MATSIAASSKTVWGFSPQSIPGLWAWLDAADTSTLVTSGGYLTQWKDKSGTNNHFNVGNANTFIVSNDSAAGYSSVVNLPNGTLSQLNSTSNIVITSNLYFFGVCKITGFNTFMGYLTGAADYALRIWQSTGQWILDTSGGPGTGVIGYFPVATLNGYNPPLNFSATGFGGGPCVNSVTGAYNIFGSPFGPTGTNTQINIAGTSVGRSTNGNFLEFLYFNQPLSVVQRQQVEGYLSAKWNLKANLPAIHPYTVLPPFNRPFYPTDISGCSLWLDGADVNSMTFSSGTTLSTWRDKSGLGNNAIAFTKVGTPTYSDTGLNGRPSITYNAGGFDGTLTVSGTTLHAFAVTVIPTITNFTPLLCVGQGTLPEHNDVRFAIVMQVRSSGTLMAAFRNNGQLGGASLVANTPFISESIFDGTNHTAYSTGTAGTSAASSGSFAVLKYCTGNTLDRLSTGYNGSVSEILIYTGGLTTAQRQQVEQYLANKWGLVTPLPTGHPGKLLPAFSTAFTPKAISGITWWLDGADATSMTFSSGSNITQWRDKSGNGFTATAGTNAPQKLPAGGVSFNAASSNYFTMGVTYSATQTMFMVSSPVPSTVVNQYYINTNPLNRGGIFLGGYNSSFISYYNGGITNFVSGAATTPFVVSLVKVAGGLAVGNYNGSQAFSVAADPTDVSTSTWTILGGSATNANLLTANIYEFIIFNVPLASNQIQQVEGYLAWKWGLQNSLPSTHAYAKFTP